jgi:hypothetical protein
MHGGIVGATLGLVLAQPVLVVVGSGAFMLSSLLFARNMWVVYRSHP